MRLQKTPKKGHFGPFPRIFYFFPRPSGELLFGNPGFLPPPIFSICAPVRFFAQKPSFFDFSGPEIPLPSFFDFSGPEIPFLGLFFWGFAGSKNPISRYERSPIFDLFKKRSKNRTTNGWFGLFSYKKIGWSTPFFVFFWVFYFRSSQI